MTQVDLGALSELRAREPGRVAQLWQQRERRDLLGRDGRLLLVAADHPARNALGVRGDDLAMADRADLLRRLLDALAVPAVDGVLGTPDVLEDLLLLGALEGRVVAGSMNRGGLQGGAFELDDRFTAYTPEAVGALGLDAGKTLTRVCLDDPSSVATLQATAEAVNSLAQQRITTIIEPFMTAWDDGRAVNLLDPESVIRSVGIASGLGTTSAFTWLKLPVVPDMERVLAATSLPTLLLGGDPTAEPEQTYALWRKALALPVARGLVIGRALLYPPDGDVTAAVRTAVEMVHGE
ncbi:deoxyribose-phosphate aldolase [Barrientosiimonas humi]|uniref:Cgl0159 family (beta/alpha)8-fold protein n=1 Tax=Barrientosiimonas humi TaxID=999931 RepID=UPI00370D6930